MNHLPEEALVLVPLSSRQLLRLIIIGARLAAKEEAPVFLKFWKSFVV